MAARKASTAKKKRAPVKIGRPTKYDPAMCEIAKKALANGFSILATAGHLKISQARLYDYIERHPAFREAIEEGKTLRAIKLEKMAMLGNVADPSVRGNCMKALRAQNAEFREPKDDTNQKLIESQSQLIADLVRKLSIQKSTD